MCDFGNDRSENMPVHFFFGAVNIDHRTAIRADIARQDYSVCPRYWYVDAEMPCGGCGETFVWSAIEQQAWFEEYRFYVDSFATRCKECRALKREMTALKKQYDRTVSAARTGRDMAQKQKVVTLIDQLASMAEDLPTRMIETRELLLKQIRNAAA